MKSLTRVLGYLKPYKKYVALTLAFAIGTTLLDLVPPWLIKVIVDRLVDRVHDGWVYAFVLMLVLAYFGRNYSNYRRIMVNNRLEQKVVFDIRSHVYRALHKLSLNYFENRSTGEIMSRVNDDVTYVERIFIDGVEQIVTASLTLIGIMIILFNLHWKLAVASLLPIPFLVIGAWKYTVRAHDLYHQVRERAAKMNGVLQDGISGIKETLAFNRQTHEIKRFEKRSDDYCRGTLEVMRLWAMYSPAMMFLGSLGTVAIIVYGIGLVQAQEITVGTLVAFIGYLALFYTPINQLHSLNHMLQHALASGERLFEIIDAQPNVVEDPEPFHPTVPVQGEVGFEHVDFAYVQDKQVLHNISFILQPGEKAALVGHTGSGKSTLVKLLMRFYDADRGEIRLDQYPVRRLSLSYLREQVGLVSQEPFLFNGTVLENILYGKLEATRGQVEQAAKAAHAHEFIENLPQGYDTLIGERGVKLSGGERHRLAIARVFLKDPPILILDEATASVDAETELKIKDALNQLMALRTTLVIAHRLSTLEGADRVLVLKNGRLVETGTHKELIQTDSEYASLFQSQLHL
ncbi:MAG: ATP-binding cassette domain-containing protein [Nitrospinaceae bacterium]|nr:ABC transporter ATP-binding protein [Nitrospinaceae bacterium]NIR54604.1 ABC transporter ATP-binding protein [Nitrospinaceae bacterium]NIS85026.1 ABC transporter ATP-binding protein [Nitrospinaceae bacterium]NIT81837.1 ABC transporter ATP-binding protein [Nitrospinaceae bacterium]NIU44100.1 ABC transporter ATP-binding protein [Nitrospinaceae bacterium]